MSEFAINPDFEKRDRILGVLGDWVKKRSSGEIRRFEFIDVNALSQLIDLKYIDPNDRENSSPSAGKIYEFMKKYSDVLVKGYAVSPHRSDYRVSLTTLYVTKEKVTLKLKNDFIAFSVNADELITDSCLYAWWD